MAQTLDNMAQFVCAKIGQTDSVSLALCYTFLNMRYRMVADAFAWRDMQIIASPDVSTVAGQNYVVLPTGIDRVISIRCNGNYLDPTDSSFQVSTNPTYLDTATGVPLAYEEYTDVTANERRIRLFPVPNAVYALRIVGKRTLNTLTNASDTPFIRNIDNTLISYAMGDMLERQRQYGKAQAKFTEAAAQLEEAKNLETAQTSLPRRAKNLTVAGNALAELTDAVCARCGTWTLDSIILAKEFLRRNYQRIYDAFPWPDAMVLAKVNSDGAEIVLPSYFDNVISLRYGAKLAQVGVADLSLYFSLRPDIFETTQIQPDAYSYLAPVGVATLPAIQERLSFVSTDATDKGNIFVRGESNGQIYTETVALNGTSAVQTSYLYDVPLTVSKLQTVGTINVTGATSGTALQTLPANERERKHIRLMVQPANGTTATTCLVLGKRRIRPLVQDEDTPAIRGVADALISYACADMMMKTDAATAATYRSQGDTAVKSLTDQITQQGARSSQIVPEADGTYTEDIDDMWLVSKS